MHEKLIIGWREYVHFPQWGLGDVLAKADTGARRSAIDVTNIVELPDQKVRFDVALSRKNRKRTHTVEQAIVDRIRVRSSNGQTSERLVVASEIQIGHVRKTIELSLVSRKSMLCRLLLGRLALEDDFLVDSLHKFMFGRPDSSKKKKRKHKPST